MDLASPAQREGLTGDLYGQSVLQLIEVKALHREGKKNLKVNAFKIRFVVFSSSTEELKIGIQEHVLVAVL